MADAYRLEPRTRTPDLQDALQGSLHDPLWLLARQWQFGELWASDGGAPALTELQMETAPLTRWSPGAPSKDTARDLAVGGTPLETLVEREPLPAAAARDLGLRTEAGLYFLRLLAAEGAPQAARAYRSHGPYAFSAADAADDRLTQRFRGLVAGRVPDGAALYRDLSAALGPTGQGTGALPAAPALAAADQPKALRAARAWLAWFAAQGISAGPGAWIPSRLEYEFSVAARLAAGEVVLTAPEYLQGDLDWDSFVVASSATLGAQTPSAASTTRVIPSPVRYRGMPAPRLWELEDARVSYGAVDTELNQKSLARMLLVEFALVFSNDWFVVPVDVGVGSVCRVNSLVVTDTFGERTAVEHVSRVDGPASPWSFFALSADPRDRGAATAPRDLFFLPPTLAASLSSRPLEDVLFLRDELANLAWAVERVVAGPSGRRIDRHEAWQDTRRRLDEATAQPPASVATGARPASAYRLGSEVPDYWIPLVPEQAPAGSTGVRLSRGTLPRFGPDGAAVRAEPLGRILEPGTELRLFDEEVPREGARVQRSFQYARWIDGSTHLWIGRSKRPGRGEGSSGLRFDYLDDGRDASS